MNFKSLAVLAALVVSVIAGGPTEHFDVLRKPETGQVIPAGTTFQIVWDPSPEYKDQTVSLRLLGGKTPETLQNQDFIVCEQINVEFWRTRTNCFVAKVKSSDGKYDWKVGASLGEFDTYGITLSLDNNPTIYQMSFPFKIKKASGGGSSSSISSGSNSESSATGTKTPSGSSSQSSQTGNKSSSAPQITSAPASTSATSSLATPTVVPTLTTAPVESSSTAAPPASTTPVKAMGAAGPAVALGGVVLAMLALQGGNPKKDFLSSILYSYI